MIKSNTPLSMPETLEYLENSEEKDLEAKKFIKKFSNLKPEKGREMKKDLEKLDLLKVKEEHVVKLIDLMPEDKESLNKIFNDVSLDEDETKKILGAIKKFN